MERERVRERKVNVYIGKGDDYGRIHEGVGDWWREGGNERGREQ